MEDKIIEIIEKISGFKEIKNDIEIDLIENEIIDSLGFIELISELEENFNIEIQPTQVSLDTWRNIKSITSFVQENIEIKK